MTLGWWLDVFRWATIVANAVIFVWLIRQMRRWQRLNLLLDRICTQAMMNQHLPIWVPWLALRGFDGYEITPTRGGRPVK